MTDLHLTVSNLGGRTWKSLRNKWTEHSTEHSIDWGLESFSTKKLKEDTVNCKQLTSSSRFVGALAIDPDMTAVREDAPSYADEVKSRFHERDYCSFLLNMITIHHNACVRISFMMWLLSENQWFQNIYKPTNNQTVWRGECG